MGANIIAFFELQTKLNDFFTKNTQCCRTWSFDCSKYKCLATL